MNVTKLLTKQDEEQGLITLGFMPILILNTVVF